MTLRVSLAHTCDRFSVLAFAPFPPLGVLGMNNPNRREFLVGAGTLAAAFVAGHPLLSANEVAAVNWPSRTIQLPPEIDERNNKKAPVVTAVRLHRQTQMLATAGDDHIVRVWGLADGKMIQRLDKHIDWVRTIDYSPDGTLLASAGNDRQILLWNAETGEFKSEFAKLPQAVTSIRFSHDGKLLAAAGFEQTVRLFDVATGKLVKEIAGPCDDHRSVAFSPDDQNLAIAGRSGVVRVSSVSSDAPPSDMPAHRQRVRAMVFSPDGAYLASAGEDRLVHISPLGGAAPFLLPRRPAKVLAITFYSPTHLATAGSDNLIRLWDVETQVETGILTGHTGSVAALDCIGNTLVSAGYDTTIRIWTITDNVARGDGNGGQLGRRPDVIEPLRK